MPGLIKDVKTSVNQLKSELTSLQNKANKVDAAVCDLSDVISSIRASTQIQEDRVAELENFQTNNEDFIKDAVRIDDSAAETVNQEKKNFYEKYSYLKPDCEKTFLEKVCDGLKDLGEWCKEHWKEILKTIVIVVGAVLAIVAVIGTGGVALVPMLATAMTALGVSAATATVIATVISISIATVAVISTIGSSTLNLMDTWGDFSNNSTFKKWQKALNITSAVSNGLYSIGNLYNSIKGVSGKEFIARQKAIENGKMGYSNLDAKHPNMRHKSGADYDSARKREILEENMRRNDGVLRSDKTGKILEQPAKSMKGVSPPKNEAQIDHIFPRDYGGANSFSNAQVIERAANIAKSNNPNFAEYLNYSIPDKGSIADFLTFTFKGSVAPSTNINIILEMGKNGN